jgi:urease accessory protein
VSNPPESPEGSGPDVSAKGGGRFRQGRWKARAELVFGLSNARTELRRIRTKGPLHMQRLFHPEGPWPDGGIPAHAYLLHPPGGLVSGDCLETAVRLLPRSHVLLTTPSAAKAYRAREGGAPQSQLTRAAVGDGSVLELLPQGTILFSKARAEFRTLVDLHPGARLLAWDMACLGRPGSGEAFAEGSYSQGMELRRGGIPILLERLAFSDKAPGGLSALRGLPGLFGMPCFGTFVAIGREGDGQDLDGLRRARDVIRASVERNYPEPSVDMGRDMGPEGMGLQGSATLRGGILIARAIAGGLEELWGFLEMAWGAARYGLFGVGPHRPRIWDT